MKQTLAQREALRRHISPMERLRIFERNGDRCHLCERLIRAGEPWDVSHDRPLALGGKDDDTNRKIAHRACHRTHTATEDQPRIAKAKRQKAKHLGAYRSARPMPGSRASGIRKRMNGDVEKWT